MSITGWTFKAKQTWGRDVQGGANPAHCTTAGGRVFVFGVSFSPDGQRSHLKFPHSWETDAGHLYLSPRDAVGLSPIFLIIVAFPF